MHLRTACHLSFYLNLLFLVAIGTLLIRSPEPEAGTPFAKAGSRDSESRPQNYSSRKKNNRNLESGLKSVTERRNQLKLLRSSGISDEILANVVMAESDSRWKRKMDELRMRCLNGDSDDSEMTAMVDDWNREKEADLRAILGKEGYRKWDEAILLGDMNLDQITLSSIETDRVYDLRKSLQYRTQELEKALRDGLIDAGDFDTQRAKALTEFDQQLNRVLGAERLAITQGKQQSTANLNQKLKVLNVNEVQLESLKKIQNLLDEQKHAYEESMLKDPSNAPDYDQFSRSLEQQKEKAYQEVLGTDAYERLQKQEDSRYTQMKQFASAWDIDDKCIDHIYREIKSYEKIIEERQTEARNLEAIGQPVDWDGISKTHEQIAEQTRRNLQNYLGEDRFSKLQRNGIFPFQN